MKKKYIVPKIKVHIVNVKDFILSISDNQSKMIITKNDTIKESGEILTKERAFYEEDNSFGLEEW